MTSQSRTDRYGTVAVSIHWLSAILIIAALATGLRAGNTADPLMQTALLRFHIPMAIAVLILTLARIVWWWRFDHKPASIGGMPRWQTRAASLSHLLFYVIILGMAGSGIGMMVLSGAFPVIFMTDGSALPDFSTLVPHLAHGIGGRLFIGLLILHVGAALYHHFIRHDGIFRRMWFGAQPQ